MNLFLLISNLLNMNQEDPTSEKEHIQYQNYKDIESIISESSNNTEKFVKDLLVLI